MDKNTLSEYGWIIIVVIILSMMFAFATPFGNKVIAKMNEIPDLLMDSFGFASENGDSGNNNNPNGHTHNFTVRNTAEEFIKTRATCTAPATYYYSCSCTQKGTTTFTSGSALGHSPGATATCTTDQTCTRCGSVVVEALGHTPGEEATCYNPQICTVCGATIQEAAHYHMNPVITAPTGTSNGYIKSTCIFGCGSTFTTPIIPTNFTVTSSNRDLVGYKGTMGEILNIPEVFESDGTWYRVTAIGDSAFEDCENLGGISLPECVTSIGSNAFASCVALDYVSLPSSVTSIGDAAFYNCQTLKSIVLPYTVSTISSDLFYHCISLESIMLSSSVTSINSGAFFECYSLTCIEFTANVTYIDETAFENYRGEVYFEGTAVEWQSKPYRDIFVNATITIRGLSND